MKKRTPKKAKNPSIESPELWVSRKAFTDLQNNLREVQETLRAIRSGEVDAVVVHGPKGNQIYSLSGADQPYRVYVERMQEGAVTIAHDGVILFANQRFADMINEPLERVISANARDLTFSAADDSLGNETPLVNDKTVVLIRNASGGTETVTFTSVADSFNRPGDIDAYSLDDGEIAIFGPFKSAGWAHSNKLWIDCTDPDLQIAVITLP